MLPTPTALPPDISVTPVVPGSLTGPFTYDKNWHLLHLILEDISNPTQALDVVEMEIYAYPKHLTVPMLIAKFNVSCDRGRCDTPVPVFALDTLFLYVRQASDLNPVHVGGGAFTNSEVKFQLASTGQVSH
jgi:hypothetical protein